jgi:hypothetical protein
VCVSILDPAAVFFDVLFIAHREFSLRGGLSPCQVSAVRLVFPIGIFVFARRWISPSRSSLRFCCLFPTRFFYRSKPSRFAAAGPQQARALVGPVKYGRVPRLLRCFAAAVFRSARQVSLVEQHAPVSVFGFVPRLRFLFQVATPASSCLLWICSIPRADFIPAHDFVRLTFMLIT